MADAKRILIVTVTMLAFLLGMALLACPSDWPIEDDDDSAEDEMSMEVGEED